MLPDVAARRSMTRLLARPLRIDGMSLLTLFGRARCPSYDRLGARRRPVEIMAPLWEAHDRFVADVQGCHRTDRVLKSS